MQLTQFLEKTAEFYFGNPDAVPLMLVLYMLPIIVILALGYSSLWIAEQIRKKLGYKTKRERELNNAVLQGVEIGKAKQRDDDECALADEYDKGFKAGQKQAKLINKYGQEKDKEKLKQPDIDKQNFILANHQAGEIFEIAIKSLLETYFRNDIQNRAMRIFHNIKQSGELNFQIDLVLVDKSGIYVIECKNWSGILIGHNSWDHWIRIPANNKLRPFAFSSWHEDKYERKLLDNAQLFSNPIIQVRLQADKLAELISAKQELPIDEIFKKIVVLRNDFPYDFINAGYHGHSARYTWFGREDALIHSIEKYQHRNNFLDNVQIDNICKILEKYECGPEYTCKEIKV